MIAAYMKRLEESLAHDPGLSARVLQEVRDHLEEALAAEQLDDPCAAERRVVERFGDPCELAAQFAPVSLARCARRAGVAIALATIAVLVMMKARVFWYAMVQWRLSEDVQTVANLVITVDRYAFWLAACIGAASLLYIARLHTPARLHADYQKHLRRAAGLFILATVPLGVSVMSDLALTVLQLRTVLGLAAVVPITSIAIEIGCIAVIAFMVGNAARRLARSELLQPR